VEVTWQWLCDRPSDTGEMTRAPHQHPLHPSRNSSKGTVRDDIMQHHVTSRVNQKYNIAVADSRRQGHKAGPKFAAPLDVPIPKPTRSQAVAAMADRTADYLVINDCFAK